MSREYGRTYGRTYVAGPVTPLPAPPAQTPLDALIAAGAGVILDFSDAYQDVAGTAHAAAGDPVALVPDLSGNGIDATQSTPANRGTATADGAVSLAGASIVIPVADGTPTIYIATANGISKFKRTVDAGAGLQLPTPAAMDTVYGAVAWSGASDDATTLAYLNSLYPMGFQTVSVGSLREGFRDDLDLLTIDLRHTNLNAVSDAFYLFNGADNVTEVVMPNMTITDNGWAHYMMGNLPSLQLVDLSGLYVPPTARADYLFSRVEGDPEIILDGSHIGGTSHAGFYRFMMKPTLNTSAIDPSNSTSMSGFARNNPNLQALDISGWDLSKNESMDSFAHDCRALTTLGLTAQNNPFANSPCIDYFNAFSLTSLVQDQVDLILIGINDAGTSNGTLTITGSGSQPPSQAGLDAAALLLGRGWTLTLSVPNPPPNSGTTIYLETPGTNLVNISDLSGTYGNTPAVGGNNTTPVVSWENKTFVTWLSEAGRAVVAEYDETAGTCSSPVIVDSGIYSNPGSHDASSIYMDSLGYLYVAYFGATIHQENGPTLPRAQGPFLRRSTNPRDITAWEPEGRARIWTVSETHGFQLKDGSVLIAGADMPALIDIIEPGGQYRWPAAKQVIAQDTSRSANPTGCQSGGPTLNRFTKAVFSEGPDGTLYTTWGWGSGYYEPDRPAGLCNDIRHYNEDSHEVFFAYSTDGGLNWKNLAGTKITPAFDASDYEATRAANAGITHNDPDYMITTQRQRIRRQLCATDDGTIYIVFAKSMWADSGVNNGTTSTATQPGALTILKFTLGGTVTETVVSTAAHYHIGGIKKSGTKLYVWAQREEWQNHYEYVSEDGGDTWSSSRLAPDGSGTSGGRQHGNVNMPGLNSIRLFFDTSGTPRNVYLYKRVF